MRWHRRTRAFLRSQCRDPRLYQLTILSALLLYGMLKLDFGVPLAHGVAIVGTALMTQIVCTRLFALPRLDLRSPLISSLSRILLLRTTQVEIAVAGRTGDRNCRSRPPALPSPTV